MIFGYLNAYESSDGDEYTIVYNKHGAILTSVNVKHFISNDVSVKRTSKRLKLYLGKDCDAYSDIYGKGTWVWANGGFRNDFKDKFFGFARQEVEIINMEKCRF